MFEDYFVSVPIYCARFFRCRFRVSRSEFDRLVDGVTSADTYFVQKQDAAGVWEVSPRQKATAALRMFCYEIAADEYLRIVSATTLEAFKNFACAVVMVVGDKYLR